MEEGIRTLNYIVHLENFERENCHVALYFEFQPALHVNIDEIADLLRKGEITSCSEGEFDVELFAEKAGSQNVTVCSPLIGSEVTLNLPIHQRYHAAREGGGYVELRIPKPKLLLGCDERIKENRISKLKFCSPCFDLAEKWREVPYNLNPEAEDYIWYVPVGDTLMLPIVTWVTNIVVTCGTLYILWILYKVNVLDERHIKQS
ncbi:uncharacterized protein LOC117171957 isoform X2 [Belonocnema kinseyi]|uniref:uncharacterized protein LOC117171957 isoform X2 n=1 Tax=Belonocnema kinseyi TaxID=2817044 RepID=UPI00143D6C2D|nr:uncharacterized protein LOC117171957 isoform X2 [Belonocnema kinseyi]